MATKAEATERTESRDEQTDGPLLDVIEQAVKKLVAKAKERGFISIDELNEALPQEQVSSEQIEDTMTMLSEMGINVVDGEESEQETETPEEPEAENNQAAAGNIADEDVGRTDDPVRMYLREMGSVELLSREGEIAIAKRIEAGREKMIGALCESPLTMRAITEWHDSLVEELMLLRDVIDLDATMSGGPDGDNAAIGEGAEGETGEFASEAADTEEGEEKEPAAEEAKDDQADGEESENGEEEDDGEDNSMSLAAMEQLLKPSVLETFENIASTYAKLQRRAGQAPAVASEGRIAVGLDRADL